MAHPSLKAELAFLHFGSFVAWGILGYIILHKEMSNAIRVSAALDDILPRDNCWELVRELLIESWTFIVKLAESSGKNLLELPIPCLFAYWINLLANIPEKHWMLIFFLYYLHPEMHQSHSENCIEGKHLSRKCQLIWLPARTKDFGFHYAYKALFYESFVLLSRSYSSPKSVAGPQASTPSKSGWNPSQLWV